MALDNIGRHGGGGRLSANAAWGVLGALLYGGGRFGILVLLAKSWPSELVGQFVLAWAIVAPISWLLNLELRLVLATDVARHIDPGNCLSLRLVSNALLGIVLGALCVLGADRWGWQKSGVILLVGGIRIVESWGDIFLAVLQRHERMKLVALSHALKLGLLFGWVALVWFFWQGRPEIVLAGWAVGTAAVVVVFDHWRAGRLESIRIRWDWTATLHLLKTGAPLGVFLALVHLNEAVARYFLGYRLGDSAVAHFGALGAVVTGLKLLQAGINQSILPRLALYFAHDIRAFWRLLGRVLLLTWSAMAAAIVLVWWQGRWLLLLLYKEEYAQHASLFVFVMVGGAVLVTAMILGDAIVACHRFKSRMIAVALGLIVNVVVCWFFAAGDRGLWGAAVGVAIAAAVTGAYCGSVLILATRQAASRMRDQKAPESTRTV